MELRSPDVAVLVVAAGGSRRMGGGPSKLFLPLAGRPVLEHSLRTVARFVAARCVVLVGREEDRAACEALLRGVLAQKTTRFVRGGAERHDSVRLGLAALRDLCEASVVLVHDAARPLASLALFEAVAAEAARCGAAFPGVPVVDTLRRSGPDGTWCTVPRAELFAVQTPQGFLRSTLEEAHARPLPDGATDDIVLVEAMGRPVSRVEGEVGNRKITVPEDLRDAESRLHRQRGASMRIGLGEDRHRLVAPGPLRLGGIDVPSPVGAVGHSDGDALLHAVTDAILGALARGDIGEHFSDKDPAHRGRDSATMLQHARQLAEEAGYAVVQVDAVIQLEAPKLAAHKRSMAARVAELLGLAAHDVSVKAKTAEGLGEVGEGRAIDCRVIVQLAPRGN